MSFVVLGLRRGYSFCNRHKLTHAAVEGGAQPAEAVAATIHDALTDRFLQPNYTVGYDALLGMTARDLMPENVFEYGTAKAFGCL
jgi:hypothetical protein